MRIHFILVAAATACLNIGSAMAGDADQTATLNPNEIICKTQPPVTGTRLGNRRECMTRAQWDRRREETQQAVGHMQTMGKMGKVPGN